MLRRAFVGGRHLEQAPIVPHAAKKRDAHGISAADEAAGTVTCGNPVAALSSQVPGSDP
jgi:hypothetical protein